MAQDSIQDYSAIVIGVLTFRTSTLFIQWLYLHLKRHCSCLFYVVKRYTNAPYMYCMGLNFKGSAVGIAIGCGLEDRAVGVRVPIRLK
jgi:hypothetical protein